MYGQKVNKFEQLWEGVPKGTSLDKSGGVPMWMGWQRWVGPHVGRGDRWRGSQVNKFEQMWPCEQTDMTENITFPHSVADGNYWSF